MTNEKNGEIIEVQKEKKMKKILSILLMCILSASFVFAGGSSETTSTVDLTTPMTHEELVAAAQAEGTLTIYTHSSRTTTIADSFEELYGINVEVTQLSDSEMIEKVSKEAIADLDAADVIYCQDGSRVYPELLMTGYVVSYTPDNVKGNIIDPQYENPLVWEVVNKVFVYNNENSSEQPLTNVWQLTEPEWAGRLQFKDPFSEAVNMNFFTMVTREDWAEKLAQAYKDLYGKELVLTTPNAGYEWIKMLYANGGYASWKMNDLHWKIVIDYPYFLQIAKPTSILNGIFVQPTMSSERMIVQQGAFMLYGLSAFWNVQRTIRYLLCDKTKYTWKDIIGILVSEDMSFLKARAGKPNLEVPYHDTVHRSKLIKFLKAVQHVTIIKINEEPSRLREALNAIGVTKSSSGRTPEMSIANLNEILGL